MHKNKSSATTRPAAIESGGPWFCAEEPPVFQLLREAGYPARRLEYEYHEGGGTLDAARPLSIPEYNIIKTLVFQGRDQAVIALMHGSWRVASRKLERLSGVRHLRLASPEEAETLTGDRPGGISPFGARSKLLLCVQESISPLEEVFFNAGRRGVIIATIPAVLALLEARWGDFAGSCLRAGQTA